MIPKLLPYLCLIGQAPLLQQTYLVMRKPVYDICEQQRRRSAAQSDQHLCVCCLDSIMPLVSISKLSSLYLASVAVQFGLCPNLSQTRDRFSRDKAHI